MWTNLSLKVNPVTSDWENELSVRKWKWIYIFFGQRPSHILSKSSSFFERKQAAVAQTFFPHFLMNRPYMPMNNQFLPGHFQICNKDNVVKDVQWKKKDVQWFFLLIILQSWDKLKCKCQFIIYRPRLLLGWFQKDIRESRPSLIQWFLNFFFNLRNCMWNPSILNS